MNKQLLEEIITYEKNTGTTLSGNVLSGGILLFFLWPVLDKSAGFIWYALLVVLSIIRTIILKQLQKTPLDNTNLDLRYRFHVIAITLSASVWALGVFWLFPIDQPIYQILFVALLVGLVSTALNLLSALSCVFPIYLFVIIGSLFVKVLIIDSSYVYQLNIVFLIYIFYSLLASNSFRKTQSELINLRIKLHEHSVQDPLTGIKNRRYFDQLLDVEWKRGVRHSNIITIMLVDIDLFKNINDLYGHPKGDEVIVAVADVIEKNMRRAGEFVSRIGGEEFAIVIPNGDNQCCLEFSEKIRLQISLLVFEDESGKAFSITASFGVACAVPDKNMSHSQLFEFADKALYKAKHEGRNCSRVYQNN